MNTLNVASALAGIKISQLDDEWQQKILTKLNDVIPGDVEVPLEATGDEIKRIVTVEVPKADRNAVIECVIFEGDEVRRFFTNVERCQQDTAKNLQYDDGVKGNFVSNAAIMSTLAILLMLGIYELTESSRGNIVESKTLSIVEMVVSSLSKGKAIIDEEVDGFTEDE